MFHPDALDLARDPRSRLIANDGRNYLKISDEKFDVITIDPPPPIDAAGVTHLYSREFVRLAKEHLKEGGIFAHWIPGPETSSGVNDLDSFKMLIRTVADEFTHVRVMSGVQQEGIHVLGSMQPFDVSREKVIERFERRGIKSDAQEWDPMGAAYFSGLQELRPADLESQKVVTDDRPHLEFDLIRIWRAGGTKEVQMSWW
jgi:spermidine synthase